MGFELPTYLDAVYPSNITVVQNYIGLARDAIDLHCGGFLAIESLGRARDVRLGNLSKHQLSGTSFAAPPQFVTVVPPSEERLMIHVPFR